MGVFMKRSSLTLILIFVLVFGSVGIVSAKEKAGVQDGYNGWVKITGDPLNHEGEIDGIMQDRENSYAWSMEIFDGYLWVGTNRNIFGTMFSMGSVPFTSWPTEVPMITDMRPCIYRMDLDSEDWEEFYVPADITYGAGPVPMGVDLGYRMMKTFDGKNGCPVLYVGSLGRTTSLIAIDNGGEMTRVFSMTGERLLSIRGIEEHDGMLFWATEDTGAEGFKARPAIWCSPDPLGEYSANSGIEFRKIPVPEEWLGERGAEVLDMVSYNDALYVFFLPYADDGGFWCGKLTMEGDEHEWELIVGDMEFGASYPSGMGSPFNGGAVPIVFKNKVYVGTMDGAAFRLMNGISSTEPGDVTMGGLHGMQIFQFNKHDKWVRVMPKHSIGDDEAVAAANGFANPYNKYIWRFGIQDNRLYAGTFDIGTGTTLLATVMGTAPPETPTPLGFDLYWTVDGEKWREVALDGFDDRYNYGTRAFVTDPETGTLYMGTANPFYGCQVWKKNP